MANYLIRDPATGRVNERAGKVAGGTVAEAGELPALDGSGRLDASIMPVGIGADTYAGLAGEALTAGDFVTINSGSAIMRAVASSGGADALGFVLASSISGAAALVYMEGRNTALTGLTPGSRVYLSATVPGWCTETPVTGTGKRHQFLGTAITSTSVAFEGDDGIILV